MQGRYEDYCTLVYTAPMGPITKHGKDLKCVVNLKNGFLELAEDGTPPANKGSAQIRSLSDSHVSLRRDVPNSSGCATIQSMTIGDGTKVTKFQWYHAKQQCSHSDPKDQSSKALSLDCKWSTGTPSTIAETLSETLSVFDSFTEEDVSVPSSVELPATPLSGASNASWYAHTYELPREPLEGEPIEALHKLTVLQADEELKNQGPMSNKHITQLKPLIPFDDDGNVTSLGSILHAEGTCKPCAFWRKDRCLKKDLCLRCHLEHDIPKHKPKTKRMRDLRYYQERLQVSSN